jgi:hypothetical protein
MRRDLPRALCAALDTAVHVEGRQRGTVAALRRELAAARVHVSDEPGLVEAPGLATALTRPFRREPDERTLAARDVPGAPRVPVWREARPPAPSGEEGRGARARLALPARLLAGAAAGGRAAAAIVGLANGPPPADPAVAGLAVAAAVALLPRLAWLAAAGALVGWLALDGRPGSALLVAAAVAPVPVLLPRAGTSWSAAAAAPLLGLAGLAPAYAALAGLAATWPRRAALGALGALWLTLAEPLLGRRLLAGPEGGAPGDWPSHASRALHNVLEPALDVRLAALAATFAVAAAVLPWLVRGRRAAPDAVAATAWAAGLGAAVQAAAAPASVRGAVVGAILAGVAVLVARAAGAGGAGATS